MCKYTMISPNLNTYKNKLSARLANSIAVLFNLKNTII